MTLRSLSPHPDKKKELIVSSFFFCCMAFGAQRQFTFKLSHNSFRLSDNSFILKQDGV